MTEELSECSECGKTDSKIGVSVPGYNDHYYFVKCNGCEARTKAHYFKEEAITAWSNNELWQGGKA